MSNKRLTRSRSDSMFLGVAGGLAQYFDIDPAVVRLVFVIMGLASLGNALLVYVLLAILMPPEGQQAAGQQAAEGRRASEGKPTAKANPFSEDEIVIQEGA